MVVGKRAWVPSRGPLPGDSAPPRSANPSQKARTNRRTRYGTVRQVGSPILSNPDFLLSLIRPPRVLGCPARQVGFARHFLRSAKFLTMAKQKNRLTTTKTLNRSVVTFFFGGPSDRTGLTDHHDIPHAFHRRPWRAVRPFEVDYRVVPTLYTGVGRESSFLARTMVLRDRERDCG